MASCGQQNVVNTDVNLRYVLHIREQRPSIYLIMARLVINGAWCFTIMESTLVLFLYILHTKVPIRYWLFWSSVSINLLSLCGASFFISTCCCVGMIIKILRDVILSQKCFTKGTVVRHCYTVAHIITLWCWFRNSALCWLLKISRDF